MEHKIHQCENCEINYCDGEKKQDHFVECENCGHINYIKCMHEDVINEIYAFVKKQKEQLERKSNFINRILENVVTWGMILIIGGVLKLVLERIVN